MSSSSSSSVTEHAVLAAVPKQLYIGGAWCDGRDGGTIAVEDPSTGATIAEVADATTQDALGALAAAHDTFQAWRDSAPRERGDILRRAYDAMTARADELALLMTLEMGKPLAESKAEVAYAANFLRWYSEEAVRAAGRYAINEDGSGRVLTMKQPIGPCVFITPWNFPLAMGTRKIGPAIAAGCTMVVKPAKLTPLSMLMLAKILEQAGLPGGVLNVVTAKSSGLVMEPVIRDPRTRKLSFTGSTEVGRSLIAQSAEQVLRVSMELGGNAPFLVFEDADLDAALDGAMIAKMRNIGEACTAANRFHVHEDVAAEFARRLAERMGALKVGRGTQEGVQVGPLIDAPEGRRARRRRGRQGGQGAVRRQARRWPRPLLRADGADRHPRRRPPAQGGDLRPGRPDQALRRRGRGDRRGQRHGVRPRRLPLHRRPEAGLPRGRGPGDRDGRAQPGDGLQRRRPVRRRQAVRDRA